MKKTTAFCAAFLAVSCLLTGCNKEEVEETIAPFVAEIQDTTETDEKEAKQEPALPEIETGLPIQSSARIAVVSKSTKGEFWDTVRKGMEDAVEAVNVAYGYTKDEQITMTFEGPGDELDVESQINTIDAVIAENPDVLCISASDMNSCLAQLEAAKENGIPVVVFDSNVTETKLIRAFRATNNTRVGKMGAYRLANAIGKMGRVAVFSAQGKTQSAQDRVNGFLDYMSNYSDIEVVEVIYEDQVEDMTKAMQSVLEKYPTLEGVFCTNADVAELYLNMEKNEGQDQVAMVGVDATSRQIEAIKKGEEIGVVSQQAYAMGYQTIWAAILTTAPRKEVELQKKLLLEPAWIDLSNMEDPQYGSFIYSGSK